MVFSFINTTWISLKYIEKDMNNLIYKDFYISVIFDYFVYEVTILLTKSLIYYFLIRNEDLPFWKKSLISIMSVMPWVIYSFII